MNNIIYKYKLKATDMQVLDLPEGAEVLSVREQRGDMMVYAFVDDDNFENTEPFTFIVRGTGHDAGNFKRQNYTFLGTVKLEKGALMFHVFYRKGGSGTIYGALDKRSVKLVIGQSVA